MIGWSTDHNGQLPFSWEVWWSAAPGSGIGTSGQERNLVGILKDGGYLPDPQPIWKCPADSEFRREGPVSLSPKADFFDPFQTSYCGNFQHHGVGWPSPPWSFPPGAGHDMEKRYHAQIYSPGNVMWIYDGPGWPCTNGSNATNNNHVEVTAWPTVIPFSDSMHRHAIDLPNHLFCDGHAQPFNLNDLRDPENYAVEGWNKRVAW